LFISLEGTSSGHSLPALALKWSPDEKQVISAGDDCGIYIWNFFE
jgi:WD40 repeat protein